MTRILINNLTEATVVADADEIPIYSDDADATRKASMSVVKTFVTTGVTDQIDDAISAITTAFTLTLLDDATAAAFLTTLGVSDFVQTILNDADASAVKATLGLTIGTDVQAYDAELAAIAGLTSAADKGIQFTGAGTAATYDLTAAGKALLDDASAAAQLTTLGVSAFVQTILDDADAATVRATIGAAAVAGSTITVQSNDVDVDTSVTTIDFSTVFTVTSSPAGEANVTVAPAGITLAMMANLAQDQFIGRTTASTGVPQTATITAAARTVLDDTTVSAMLTTLGVTAAAQTVLDDTTVAAMRTTLGVTDIAISSMSGGYVTRSGTNLLFSPDRSNRVRCFESSLWIEKTIPDTGITVACTGLSNSTVYYLYVYDSAGTLTLDLTTTAPTTQNGIAVKTGTTSRTLIARCRTNSSGAIVSYVEDTSRHFICNEYNRRQIPLFKQEATASWTYQSTTLTTLNSSTANRVEWYASGKDAAHCHIQVASARSASGDAGYVALDLDGTTGNDSVTWGPGASGNSVVDTVFSTYVGTPAEGVRFLQAMQACASITAAVTFYGDNGGAFIQSGMSALVWG